MNEKLQKAAVFWQVQESNLQQYRVLALTTQSFLVAVGALVVTMPSIKSGHSFIALGLAIIGFYHLLFVWHPIVRSRGLMADYYKFQVLADLSDVQIGALSKQCTADDYVNDGHMRSEVLLKVFNREGKLQPTRRKLDIVTPLLYGLVWIVLLLLHFIP